MKDYTKITIEAADEDPTVKLLPAQNRDEDLVFRRFRHDLYHEVRINPMRAKLTNTQAVFQNKEGDAKIIMKPRKIIVEGKGDNIDDALALAADKGWKRIKIKGGSREMQSQLWLRANLAGFETSGYRPTVADTAKLKDLAEKQNAWEVRPMSQEKTTEEKTGSEASEKTPATTPERDGSEATGGRSETVDRAKQEIMAEVLKVVPLDEETQNRLQQSIESHLTSACSAISEQKVNVVKEHIRQGLSGVRDAFERAANNEQKTPERGQQKVPQERTR